MVDSSWYIFKTDDAWLSYSLHSSPLILGVDTCKSTPISGGWKGICVTTEHDFDCDCCLVPFEFCLRGATCRSLPSSASGRRMRLRITLSTCSSSPLLRTLASAFACCSNTFLMLWPRLPDCFCGIRLEDCMSLLSQDFRLQEEEARASHVSTVTHGWDLLLTSVALPLRLRIELELSYPMKLSTFWAITPNLTFQK